jgi:phospholipid/cholesterol/gamma-HCH transport system ATP-binding protein
MAGPINEYRISVEGVYLRRGERTVFEGLDCHFRRGEISVLMGGSGAGKSTLLRMIGGLLRPNEGSVCVAGEMVSQLPERDLFRVRDRIGMLFQEGALLDSMTVFENVALPLREHTKLSHTDIAAEVGRRLDAVGLENTEHLFPRELSGGMLRRAALARAIVTDPEIVLCDEPFSGLDPVNVRRIEDLLVELNRRLGITLVLTSHHVPSSLRMAHQIVFMVDGKAVCGAPDALRNGPDKRARDFFEAELGGVQAEVAHAPEEGRA